MVINRNLSISNQIRTFVNLFFHISLLGMGYFPVLFADQFATNCTFNPATVFLLPSVTSVPINLESSKFDKFFNHLISTLLKMCFSHCRYWLIRLSQTFYDKEIFPDGWKAARVQPVSKKGSKVEPSNYISISLLPTIIKVMETLKYL